MRVDLAAQEVVKFLPSSPPMRGENILIDGVRCRVTWCRVKWDGSRWTIKSLRARPAPLAGQVGPPSTCPRVRQGGHSSSEEVT